MNYKTKNALHKAFIDVFFTAPLFMLWAFVVIFIPIDFYATWNGLVEPYFTKNWDLVLDAVGWLVCLHTGYDFYKRYKAHKQVWD